jgi:hypothetical protein
MMNRTLTAKADRHRLGPAIVLMEIGLLTGATAADAVDVLVAADGIVDAVGAVEGPVAADGIGDAAGRAAEDTRSFCHGAA